MTVLTSALEYISYGWRLTPYHAVTEDGKCTCQKPECARPGKHPKHVRFIESASTDSGQIHKWFGLSEPANPAIIVGRKSGVVVLDVESVQGHGEDGLKTLQQLEKQHGRLPATRGVRTPTGGGHLYFSHPGKELLANLSQRELGPGLELRAEAVAVLAPPSGTPDGSYAVTRDRDPAPLPDWLLEMARGEQRKDEQLAAAPPFTPSPELDDQEIWNLAIDNASNGYRIAEWKTGDWSSHQSWSEADAALISALAFYTQSEEQLERLWKDTALWRGRKGGKSAVYATRTIRFCLRKTTETYSGPTGGIIIRSKPSNPENPPKVHSNGSGNHEVEVELLNFRARKECKPSLPLELLPPELAELSSHMAEIWNVDPALYAVPGLAVLSTAIGNTVRVHLPGGDSSSAMLWITVVASTGKGKTPAAKIVRKPLDQAQQQLDDQYKAAKDWWDSLSKKDKDQTPRPRPAQLIVTDASWESVVQSLYNNPAGVAWWKDEVIGLFKQLIAFQQKGSAYGSEDNLSVWSQEDIRRQRIRDMEYTVINNPYLVICGGLQPKKVAELGGNEAGRLSRLLCYSTDIFPNHEADYDPDLGVLGTWNKLVDHLVEGRLTRGRDRTFTLSGDAKEAWRKESRENYERLKDADEDERDFLAKADQHAARLACIKHTCKEDSIDVIDCDTIKESWKLARIFMEHQMSVYTTAISDFVVDPKEMALDKSVKALDAWIEQHGGKVQRRAAQRARAGGARTPGDMTKLIERWQRAGLGTVETVQRESGGSPEVWLQKMDE